jgi:hypothetical protein
MMYSVDLYHNLCLLEQLGHELRTNMKTNALKTVLIILIYSSFQSFVASSHHTKSPKGTKLF